MRTEKHTLRCALVGNPNCGKTTLFNRLTGSRQYVGNWPGVTVEKKEGEAEFGETLIKLVDLPGTYSLDPYSPEEALTGSFLLEERPDVVIDVVDATNLERNLYLTTQLMELGIPVVAALNMLDVLEKRGDHIDARQMEVSFGVPFVSVSAAKGIGMGKLLERVCAAGSSEPPHMRIYPPEVERSLQKLESLLPDGYASPRWASVLLLQGNRKIAEKAGLSEEKRRALAEIQRRYADPEGLIADLRYRYLCAACGKAVKKSNPSGRLTASDQIDKVVTNRFLAIPLFLCMIFAVFAATFGPVGSLLTAAVEKLFGALSRGAVSLLAAAGASPWAKSLMVDGVLSGLGAVLSFLPQLVLLFLMLSILEDSGYMARAAFIMDRMLRKVGLSGRAFVPLLMGFGCTVPAVMGTRILESTRDKRLTILITPFMSCSAKTPVYALFISAFFLRNKPAVIFSIYLFGVVFAVLSALLFKNTILQGEQAPFVMELPPYRFPTPGSLFLHVWERVRDFLEKAGTVLLGATVAVWFLQYFTPELTPCTDSSQSILARFGMLIAPVFTLCGFGEWKPAVSLVTGLVAKETVVSTMQVLYQGGCDASLSAAVGQAFTPLSAYSFMLFVLLYTPCVAALSAIRREMGSLKWTAVTVGYQLASAWFVSALFYQTATLAARFF